MMRLAEAMAQALEAAAARDPRIWIIDGDLGDSYGLEAVGPRLGDRYVQAGIAEQAMVSLAAGLASCGARPWVFSFAAFLCCRAYDQIRVSVSQTRLPVVLIGSHAGGCVGKNGKTHTIVNDLAMLGTLPALEVWAPADAEEAAALVPRLLAAEGPAYVRLPRDPQPALPRRREGSNACSVYGPPAPVAPVAMVASGLATQWALRARDLLAGRGIELPVIHVAQLAPFPAAQVAEAIAGARRLVAIEDHYSAGGLADLLRRHFPEHRVRACGWPPAWPGASGDAEAVRAAHQLDDEALASACLAELAKLPAAPSLDRPALR